MGNEYIDKEKFRDMLIFSANYLNKNKNLLNNLNVFPVPDGDTGTNMFLTLKGAVDNIKRMDGNLSQIAEVMSEETMMEARGCSGMILSQWFKGFFQVVKGKQEINTIEFITAFKKAAESAYQAVEDPVEGTILTVMRESAGIPINLFKEKRRLLDVAYLLQEILSLAKESLSKTPEMLSVLKDAGVVDAGAQGFVFILEAMSNSLNGRNPKLLKKILPKKIQGGMESAKEHLVYKFCVECVVEGKNSKLNQIRNKLNDYGKSLIMAKSNGLLKVHLHTNHPQKLLQYCSSLGKLVHSNTKNMEKQQETFLSSSGNINKRKKIGIVVSTIGQGLSKIFKSMGADVVIVGKKTINPSLRDLTKAIKRLKAKNIIVLPNDSNVLPIAKEAVKMFNNTYIIPSQTIPQGISALLAFSEEASLTNNRQNMNKALKKVKSGILTQSLKNGKDNQIKFKKNDILGFYEGHLKSVGKNFYKVALNLINNMIKEDDTIISLFYGKKVNQEEAKKLLKMIRSQHSHVETELYYGGQPNYPFIISID